MSLVKQNTDNVKKTAPKPKTTPSASGGSVPTSKALPKPKSTPTASSVGTSQKSNSLPKTSTSLPKPSASKQSMPKPNASADSRKTNENNQSPFTSEKPQTPQSRSSFSSDRDYENYILDNKIDYTKGDAFEYLKSKAHEQGIHPMKYMEGMRSRYKNTRETEKIAEKVKNGDYPTEKLADINDRFYALIDNDGNEVDIDTYNNEANMIDSTYGELNKRLEKVDKDYYDGKIDYQTRVNEHDRINALLNENTANAERLQSYKQVSGFDYYDWAKSVGKDVTDFEAYAENLNDNGFERLAQAYGASWWDTLATRPEMLSIVRTALDPNYDIRNDKLSTNMRATANELREYAFAGSTGFEKWSLTGLSALMPMVNESMINQVLPLDAIVGGYSSLTGATMTAEQTAQAVGKLAGNLTNATLGIQTAGEVLRQRLDEGNNKLTALADASIHGVITAMVEGMDAGSTINFLTGGIGKHLATLSLFGKPSVLRSLGNMAMAGHDEGKEEVIETGSVFLADTVLNAVSSIANSFGIDALQKVNVDPLNVADMANEYALAFFGTAVLGAPATAGDFITTKRQYNSILKAREHFESVLNTPLASNLEKAVARKSIENIDYALGTSPVAESDIAKAVTTSEDFTEPLPTYDSLMNELANAMRPDVQDDIQRVQKTIDYSEYLRSQMQRELDERGLNSTVDRFMSTDNKTRDEIMRSSDFLNDNNINSFILKMKRGLNGARTEGGVLLNTDQTASYDIDKVADMDDKEFDAKIDLDDSEMLRDAGIAPSMIRSAFHESSHWAEQSDLWLSVRNMVRDAMGAKRFDTFTNRIEKIYDKQGIEVENPETETVAFYLQKYLDDPKFLERMARYNSSFLNRFFSNAIAKLKGDEKIKLQNLYLDALRDAQNSATQELAPEYSVSSLFQAIGMTIHKESEVYNDDGSATTTFYAEDENGNKVREVTEEMVKDSPLGQMLQEAQDRGFIEDSNNQVTMVATIYNSILKSQDPEMFWAVFGSIGFGRAHVGTSSWDVSRPQHFASFTTNSDPQYGHTFDVTTICTKTQQLIDVASETMKRLNRGLTEDEVIDVVYNEVFKAGEPVPCPVCYVFSRWVGIGGVLENIKNFQEKYKGANLDELRDRYEVLSKQVDEISEKRGIRGSKAIEELRKQTDQEVVDRYETLFGQEIVERMGGKKLTAEERAEFESLKKDLEVLNDWAWLTRVVLDVKVKKGVKTIKVSKDYVEIGDVPNEILFDLNKGEDFAKYPAWKYRASRGQRYGKIIAPYSDMVLGQTIMGFANPSDSSIKSLGQKRDKKSNAFLDMKKVRKQNQLYDKAVANARVQNLKNGSRAQSTSDFRFEYITDYILHFMQLQSIGSYGQTYTKVPEAVPVLCSVGYEVNMSLMPKGKGYKPAKKGDPYAYYVEGFDGVEDGWYTIDCSSVTGINPDVAFYLRTQYDNAQTIMVGINDVHLFLCRQDPRVDFIIPYHASGGSAEHYASMMNTVHEGADLDANDRVDYSEVSNENEEDLPVLTEDQKYARELREKILTQNLPNPTEEEIRFMQQGTGILWNLWNRFYVEGVDDRCYEVNMGKKPAIFPYEYWDETSTRENADVNGMRYVQYCKELGYKPKFESLSNGDGSGGYWKCLPDRSMYNVDGTSHIQKAINMDNFSSDFLYKGKIQEGIVQPIAEQENVPLDENDPRYQELRKRVLSQQFNKEKTMPIVDDVVKRIKDGKIKIQASASGQIGWENLLENGTLEERWRASYVLGDLGKAIDEMERYEQNPDGEDVMQPYDIWRAYGWIKKADGKWRYQIYDKAEETMSNLHDFLFNAIGKESDFIDDGGEYWTFGDLFNPTGNLSEENNRSIAFPLEDFIESDNVLFNMYPQMRTADVRFYFDDDEITVGGYYNRGDKSININLAPYYLLDDDKGNQVFEIDAGDRHKIYNAFFHELQHLVQHMEGLQGGTNTSHEKSKLWEKRKKINNEMVDMLEEFRRQGISPATITHFADASERGYYESSLNSLLDKYPEQADSIKKYNELSKELASIDVNDKTAYERYYNNLGEIEAREEADRAVSPSGMWSIMPETNGYIDEGANESRDEAVPTSVGGNDIVPPNRVEGEVVDDYGEQKTQRFASSNIPKSDIFNESQKEQVDQEIKDGLFTYVSSINDVEVQRAKEYMERDGVDKTFKTFMENDRPDMKSVVQGTVLVQELAKNNDPRWHDVAVKLADDATMAGQFLQAYTIMQKLTPEGQLMSIRRSMRRMQNYINNKLGNKAPQLEISTELEEEMRNAKTQEEREKVAEKIREDLERQIPTTFRDWINSWRYLAMLGNPRTHVRNFFGDGVFIPAITLKNVIGTALEGMFGKNLKYKTKAVLNRFSEQDRALLELGKTEYDVYKGAIEKGQRKYERKAFPDKGLGKLLNWMSNKNSKAMDKTDFWFAKARYASSFAQVLKANGMTAENATPEVISRANAYAIRESLRATYRDANAVADWLNELENSDKEGLRMASYVKDALIPFTKTPMNIIKRGVRYSPVGLAYTVTHDLKKLHDGKISANDFLDNLAQGLTGTSIAVLGAWLASLGLFRTKDDDKDRKQYFDSENGEQDYAIDLSPLGLKGTYTIDWATPVIMPFAIGAELFDVFTDFEGVEGFDDAISAVADISAKIMDPVMETSMLSSLQDALKSYSTSGGAWLGDMVMSMASSYIQQMFPTFGGQLARTIDDTRRTTYPNNGALDKLGKQLNNKIPWRSQLNEPYINRKGQEEKTEGGNMLGRAFLNMFSPGYYSSKEMDEYDDEIYRLYDSTGELDAFPSNSSRSITFDKEKFNFTDKEYTEWHKKRWQTEDLYVNQFIDSQTYKNLSDEERIATIKDIRSYAQLVAKKQFLESKGYIYTDDKELAEKQPDKYIYDKQLTNASGAVDNGIKLYAFYDYLNNGGTKQAEKIQYLSGSDLSQEQKDYLWSLSDYKTSYADAYRKVMGGSSSKKKSSSKSKNGSSKKVTSVSAGGINKARGGGTTGKLKASPMASNPDRDKSIANNYFRAYANTFRRGSKNVSSASGNTVVCPRCGNRVSSTSGRCPICGQSL